MATMKSGKSAVHVFIVSQPQLSVIIVVHALCSYAFDTKVSLKEVGRSINNSSEALIAGFVTLNDGHDVIHFNYFHTTGDKFYDAVVLSRNQFNSIRRSSVVHWPDDFFEILFFPAKEGKNRFQMHASGNHTFKTPSDNNVPYPASFTLRNNHSFESLSG